MTRVAHINRIQHTRVRLNGRGLIATRRAADVTVRVHEARHDDLARDIARGRALGNGRAARTNRHDFSALHHEHTLLNGLATDGDDLCAGQRQRCLLRRDREDAEREAKAQDNTKRNRNMVSQDSIGDVDEIDCNLHRYTASTPKRWALPAQQSRGIGTGG